MARRRVPAPLKSDDISDDEHRDDTDDQQEGLQWLHRSDQLKELVQTANKQTVDEQQAQLDNSSTADRDLDDGDSNEDDFNDVVAGDEDDDNEHDDNDDAADNADVGGVTISRKGNSRPPRQSEPMCLDDSSPVYVPVLTDADLADDPPGHRSDFVAVIGKPNAGGPGSGRGGVGATDPDPAAVAAAALSSTSGQQSQQQQVKPTEVSLRLPGPVYAGQTSTATLDVGSIKSAFGGANGEVIFDELTPSAREAGWAVDPIKQAVTAGEKKVVTIRYTAPAKPSPSSAGSLGLPEWVQIRLACSLKGGVPAPQTPDGMRRLVLLVQCLLAPGPAPGSATAGQQPEGAGVAGATAGRPPVPPKPAAATPPPPAAAAAGGR
eukprot:jgi/Chrzof1/15108/Cz09g27130.t1